MREPCLNDVKRQVGPGVSMREDFDPRIDKWNTWWLGLEFHDAESLNLYRFDETWFLVGGFNPFEIIVKTGVFPK